MGVPTCSHLHVACRQIESMVHLHLCYPPSACKVELRAGSVPLSFRVWWNWYSRVYSQFLFSLDSLHNALPDRTQSPCCFGKDQKSGSCQCSPRFLSFSYSVKSFLSMKIQSIYLCICKLKVCIKIEGKRRSGWQMRWDGWLASPIQWTWIWADSGS